MKRRRTLSSLAAAALLVATIAVPVASAMPTDPVERETATETADPTQDRRSENAADSSRAPEPPVGMPTWPVDPQVLTPPATPEPVAADDGDGGIDVPVSVLAIAGATLLLAGGLAVVGIRHRAGHTHAT